MSRAVDRRQQGRVGFLRPVVDARPLPRLRPGQVRCPACRVGVTPLATGVLRTHLTPGGRDCYQRHATRLDTRERSLRAAAEQVAFADEWTAYEQANRKANYEYERLHALRTG